MLHSTRIVLLAAVLLAGGRSASAQLATTELEGVRFVYLPGTQDYLVPHAARTFLNAFAFHKKLFGFEPSEEVTVLMLDLEDTGNASATSVPRDLVTVQIAPLNFAFETIAGNDRMNIIMNHELLHVVAMDQASRGDRRFRRLFGGKVTPVPAQPESILYFFLTTPRVAAPRWFHEGAATFFDTWMAGGLGRAQSGYDEMVFRSMVKDGTPMYDPLGLVSEGTKIDFQLQINSYLYGTRFMVWLARTYGPSRIVEWVSRRDGSRAYYAAQFKAVFGTTIEEAWARWTADEVAFQKTNLEAIRTHPITPSTDLTARALGSVSRALSRRAERHALRRRELSRHRVARRGHRDPDRGSGAAGQRQGPDGVHRDLAGARSRQRHAVLHHRQRLLARPGGARPGDTQGHAPAEGRAHRRSGVRSHRQVAVGHPPARRPRHHCPRPGALPGMEAGPHVRVRHHRLRPRRLA